jgi:outer membrane protein OmpA-like peptidoglycan-associated protein/peptidoglycan hydrolase-like protein with peptidoglycan-binding domain
MPQKPVLDELELELVQRIDAEEDQVLDQFGIPALEGDFFQRENRRSARFTLTGVVTGEEASQGLEKLRDEFRNAEPVPFVSDIATALKIEKVLIEEFGVREIAGRPERFEYAFTLREFKEADRGVIEPPPPPPPPPEPVTTLEVKVTVEGEPDFDFSNTRVTLSGTTSKGAALNLTLTERNNNIWTKEPMEPGRYTFTAVNPEPDAMSGSVDQDVQEGVHPNRVEIVLRRNSGGLGDTYVVHFRFDKAFVEPCMREVLQRAFGRIRNGPANEKILIIGHTDLTGTNQYNQSLSERRARSVFAMLTFGLDAEKSVAEWDELRRQGNRVTPFLQEGWGVCEYQHMLQDLNFYNGKIDGIHGPITTAGLRRFQESKNIPVTGTLPPQDEVTWKALIRAYLAQDSFAAPAAKFLPNCPGEILKWLGHGEEDWVKNTQDPWRPNRRTEVIFLRANKLACKVPKPDTFDLPAAPAPQPPVNSGWCVGDNTDAEKRDRFCFLKRPQRPDNTRPAPAPGAFTVQPAEPGDTAVHGRMEFEDGRPAGGVRYTLIAPDGEYMDGEVRAVPTECYNGNKGTTRPDGTFSYDTRKPVGTYIMAIDGPFVARLKDEPGHGKGNVVCKFLSDDASFDIVLAVRPTSLEFVDAADPSILINNVIFGQPFKLRAEIPGETRDEVVVELTSYLVRR